MTPDEVIPDRFRGESSMKKKGRQIFLNRVFTQMGLLEMIAKEVVVEKSLSD